MNFSGPSRSLNQNVKGLPVRILINVCIPAIYKVSLMYFCIAPSSDSVSNTPASAELDEESSPGEDSFDPENFSNVR